MGHTDGTVDAMLRFFSKGIGYDAKEHIEGIGAEQTEQSVVVCC